MYDAIETGLNIANQYLAEEISKDEAESQLTKCYTTVIGYAKAAEEAKIDLLSEEGQARYDSIIGGTTLFLLQTAVSDEDVEAVKEKAETLKNILDGKPVLDTEASSLSSQEEAISSAKNHLEHSIYSRESLYLELLYEGYTEADAEYAADHCGADWNEQALGKAKSYLKSSAFSYSGLIDQLEYEDFTTEQATYAVDNCGADWNEQAIKCAERYIKYTDLSGEKLVSQLEYEGFTYEQAVYGAQQSGGY